MLKQGFIDEVEKLYRRNDLSANLPSIRAVGYRQAWEYLAGKINQQEMRDLSIAATRQLAKRQLTWLRSWQNQHQLSMESTTLIEDAQNYFEQAIK